MPILLSCGSNAQGQLAHGDEYDSNVFLPALFAGEDNNGQLEILDLACGANHTLLLGRKEESGTTVLWGCGDGSLDQLGPRFKEEHGSSPIFIPLDLLSCRPEFTGYSYTAIATSWQTSYIVISRHGESDLIFSMGTDDYGDLGIGGRSSSTVSPCIVNLDHLFSDGPPFSKALVKVERIRTGQHHVIAHLTISTEDGYRRILTVGWGAARHGQLGRIGGHQKPPARQNLPFIITDNENELISISLGSQHSVFTTPQHRILGIGSNRKGQLEDLENLTHVTSTRSTWNGTYAIRREDSRWSVTSVGSSSKGQLGRTLAGSKQIQPAGVIEFPVSPETHDLVQIACGSEHVLALFKTSDSDSASPFEVYAWGWNEHGNIGNGSNSDVLLPTRVWPPPLDWSAYATRSAIYAIWAGPATSWIAVK